MAVDTTRHLQVHFALTKAHGGRDSASIRKICSQDHSPEPGWITELTCSALRRPTLPQQELPDHLTSQTHPSHHATQTPQLSTPHHRGPRNLYPRVLETSHHTEITLPARTGSSPGSGPAWSHRVQEASGDQSLLQSGRRA